MAAGATYEPIATTTLGTAAATITFSSIPATYTDLRLIVTATASSASQNLYYLLNSDTATNYSQTYINGDGASATSSRSTSQTLWWGAGFTTPLSTTIPALDIIDIFSYAGSTYKTGLFSTSNDLNGSGAVFRQVQLWRSTAAINRIDVKISAGNMKAGTTATLYGIKSA